MKSKTTRGKKVERICACGCGRKFMARVADVKRGWGKFFSKSCKAIKQTRDGGPDGTYEEEDHPFSGDIQL